MLSVSTCSRGRETTATRCRASLPFNLHGLHRLHARESVTVSLDGIDVAPVEGVHRSLDELHVLVRHRLPRQPHGFDGFGRLHKLYQVGGRGLLPMQEGWFVNRLWRSHHVEHPVTGSSVSREISKKTDVPDWVRSGLQRFARAGAQ
jgi:hypothetical protein